MTNEEAHRILEDFQRLLTNYRHISPELTEANGLAIRALEKQIPKPSLSKSNYNGAEFCPTCGEYLGQTGDRDLYCTWCGQRIGDYK